MKKTLLFTLLVSALFLSFERLSKTQTKPQRNPSEQDQDRPKLISLKIGEPDELTYDGGTVRFLATSEDTNGAWSLVELREMPGYHTNLHPHNHTDEAFYVIEGLLTVKINDKISDHAAGSYVLIPRGTPHAQGNVEKFPPKFS
jgi:quercetin dioxygenase-like cupin family protein